MTAATIDGGEQVGHQIGLPRPQLQRLSGVARYRILRLPAELVNEVAFRGERVMLQRNGNNVVGVVSAGDMELLELLEDQLDLDEARRRLADGKKPLSYAEARKSLGL